MARVTVGCCGTGFFSPKAFFGEGWKEEYASALSAYAALFPLLEVNSSFYKLPQEETARRWLSDARAENNEFEFTVKAFRGITHEQGFAGKSLEYYAETRKVCSALKAKILLFQTPASFAPTAENMLSMEEFFSSARRGKLAFAWEPRGEWLLKPELVRAACDEFGLVECVDPLRNGLALKNERLAYFRLHGFGKQIMYNYRFSDAELRKAMRAAEESGAESASVLFNNYQMYFDARRLVGFLRAKKEKKNE